MASHVLETLWPCHWERIYTIQVDYPLSHPEFYARAHPDIADFNVLSDEMQGDVRYYLCEFIAATEIPPVVRHVVRPDMLNWTQEAWWRGDTLTCRARIRPNFLTDYFDILSEWQLFPMTETQTREVWTFNVDCSFPVFGGFIAGQVLSRGVASHMRNRERFLEQLTQSGGE